MTQFRNSSIVRLALACMLIVGVSMSQAQSPGQAQSPTHLDKHARKIHHKLTKYPSGQYLHLVLRDSSNSYGVLGTLSAASFTFVSAENNATSSYFYSDIDKVKSDKQPIGAGSERHMRHLIPIVVTLAAVGAAGAIYATVR